MDYGVMCVCILVLRCMSAISSITVLLDACCINLICLPRLARHVQYWYHRPCMKCSSHRLSCRSSHAVSTVLGRDPVRAPPGAPALLKDAYRGNKRQAQEAENRIYARKRKSC